MIQIAKKVSIFGFIMMVSCLGIGVGQSLTRQTAQFQWARFAAAVTPQQQKQGINESQEERYRNLELFNRVLSFVQNNYVDKVDNKTLIEGAIQGMMEKLDPHSAFLPATLYKDMQIDTSGKFGGLGIEIGMKDNILTVLAPIEDTPAWRAGLKPNDRIVKINSESTKGVSLEEAVSKMRGKPHTEVVLSIYREGFDRIKDIRITRDIIKIEAVKSALLESGYGYIRLTTFNENAASDMKKAIDGMMKKEKLKGLVFDLRTNPGGLLDQAVEVASLFIDDGVIVSTIGRNRDQKDVKYAHKGMAYKGLPLAVLVNSSTASAAEIVAGALQDHHRALILGQSTFGKGSVQTVIPLPPDMGLKLTIARYYTPSGKSIQERGVRPDIFLDEYDPKLLAQAKIRPEEFRERDLKGHMVNPDGVEVPADEASSNKDFKKDELDAMLNKKKGSDKSSSTSLADDMTPIKINPKDDYEVRQALISLKSLSVMNTVVTGAVTTAEGKGTQEEKAVVNE